MRGVFKPELLWALLLAVLGLAAGYGARGQQVGDVERRVAAVETRVSAHDQGDITQREYQELIKRLDRIESKIDRHMVVEK